MAGGRGPQPIWRSFRAGGDGVKATRGFPGSPPFTPVLWTLAVRVSASAGTGSGGAYEVADSILERLAKQVIIGDGAMGTMLYSKGIYINRCFDELNLTNPELVRDVHRDYVAAGCDFIETNTSRPNRRSTPASMAEAMDIGMRSITRSNQPVTPEIVINKPQNRKAPTASAIGTPTRLVANSAAPGVDHAVNTGAR